MEAFCTVITKDYIPYALAMASSVRKFSDIPVYVLICNSNTVREENSSVEGVRFLGLDDLFKNQDQEIGTGEHTRDARLIKSDSFRWSLKPILIQHLLRVLKYSKVIFVDWDVIFFSNYEFLFDQLAESGVLLSPHFRSLDPRVDPKNFDLNFTGGIFNGGFFGASKKGLAAVDWWAKACRYACEIDLPRGRYVDQKYLDLIPGRFQDVSVIDHLGCNIANWNRVDCQREKVADQVLINGKWPIIFIHFTKSTVRGILNGQDALLMSHLLEYEKMINRFTPGYTFQLPPPAKRKRKVRGKPGVYLRVKNKLKAHLGL